jgi:cobalt-zinc-cadmium efflux system outer membrane protein
VCGVEVRRNEDVMRLTSPLLLATGMLVTNLRAQTALTWQQVKARFEAANPTLKAAQASISESRANEITAHLKPNPDVSLTADGFQFAPNEGVWQPLTSVVLTSGTSYLIERGNKRNLRYAAAKQSTAIAASDYRDQERSLLFTLRSAFVQTLQAKAVLQNAQENLDYWDRELMVNRTRLNAGDIAQADLNRLQLQRFQFESDLENATVNLQTAKIQLRELLNDNTPLERFDVTGPFDYAPRLAALQEFEKAAVETRPDLKAAYQNVELARRQHSLAIANGSWDPTISGWYSHNGSFSNTFAGTNTVGGSVSIPLRIHDRNQGEKARTQLDIGRNESLKDAALATVLSDVETAYRTLGGVVGLLQTRETYLKLAESNRNTLRFSYLNGGASLLDYLDTEKTYRDTRLQFINLVGSYLTAAAQMNMAVGREVIP